MQMDIDVIAPTEAYLTQLRSLVDAGETLKRHGFITQPLTHEQLLSKQRCQGCGKVMSQLNKDRLKSNYVPKEPSNRSATVKTPHSSLQAEDEPELYEKLHVFRCKYHPGQVVDKHWTCCFQHVSGDPCGGTDTHIPRVQHLHDLVALHQYHLTPTTNNTDTTCAAVAIDCEMGTAVSGDSELIRVTMIDYFTGAVLVNNIVEPDVPMLHLNTRYSGVSWGDLNYAKRRGTCLAGKAQARSAIWRSVGPETVVVGHGLSNDLRALRWIHGLVVDSFLIEFNHAQMHKDDEEKRNERQDKEMNELSTRMEKSILSGVAVTADDPKITGQKKKRGGPGRFSLKTLTEKYLHANIQSGNKGHDSFEDAVAARNLVHWMMTNGERACCEQHALVDSDK